MRPQQEIDGVAGLVDGTVQILPLALNLDVGLVHAPTTLDLRLWIGKLKRSPALLRQI
jgi:hypothetical protein